MRLFGGIVRGETAVLGGTLNALSFLLNSPGFHWISMGAVQI